MTKTLVPILLVFIATAEAQNLQQWSVTGSLTTPRSSACLVGLADGRVLAAGGAGPDGSILNSAEIYADPAFSPTGSMNTPRSDFTCTLLNDGRVLAVGGIRDTANTPSAGAEIFDPSTGSWTALPDRTRRPRVRRILPRWGHTATGLPDGSVLIAGGEAASGPTNIIERYDAVQNGFSALSSVLSSPRKLHAAVLLKTGLVMIAGGNDGHNDLDTIDIVDPWNDAVSAGPHMPQGRSGLKVETLVDGRAWIAGGSDLATTLFLDPLSGILSPGPTLTVRRSGHQLVRIPGNGGILVIGGTSAGVPTPSTELYDALQSKVVPFGNLTLARTGLAAVPIGETGSILAVGGSTNGVAVAACGKTTAAVSLSSNKSVYTAGESAVITVSWGTLKENITVTVQLTPVSGAATQQVIATSNAAGQVVTVTTNPLTGPSTALVTALGATTGLSAVATFQVDTTSQLTFLSPVPLPPVLIQTPVLIRARLHPTSAGAISGVFILKEGPTIFVLVNTVDLAHYHVDGSGDGIVDFALPNGFSAFGTHNLTATFQAGANSTVAGSSTAGPLPYAVNRLPTQLSGSFQNPPVRILGTASCLAATQQVSGFPSPTGFVALTEGTDGGITLARVALSAKANLFRGFSQSSSATLQITTTSRTGRRQLILRYEGDSLYEPVGISLPVDQHGVAPNLSFAVIPEAPATAIAPGAFVTLNITFTPQIGLDPFPNPNCVIPTCVLDYNTSATIDQNGVSDLNHLGDSINSFRDFDPARPNINGTPFILKVTNLSISEVGAATITAHFSGADNLDFFHYLANYSDASVPISFAVTAKGTPKLELTAVVATTSPTKTVRLDGIGSARDIAPSGTFQIFEGSTLLGSTTAPLVITTKNQLEIVVPATSGTHTYSLVYSGDVNYNAGTTSASIAVP